MVLKRDKVISHKKYLLIKTFFDIFFSIIFIILTSPIFILISILIKFNSRGPIFFYIKELGKMVISIVLNLGL